jgi:ATP-binding protein involved in chromosome partitioning
MAEQDTHSPSSIRQHSATELAITWSDGAESLYDVRQLRLACRCAHCVDEWTGDATLDPASVPEDVKPVQIRRVGLYGIQFYWSDDHNAGIYTFEQLRDWPIARTTPPPM